MKSCAASDCAREFAPKNVAHKYCRRACSDRESKRRYRAANPEKYRAIDRRRRKANREEFRERYRRWYAVNRGKVCEKVLKWQAENPEKACAKQRRWRAANPEKQREAERQATHRRRARKVNASGYATAAAIKARVAFYGGLCWMCGAPADTIDHVIPLAAGGSNWPANLRPACLDCNLRKGARKVA